MKCVQLVGQGVPVRVSDEDAYQLVVIDKDAEYCPKWIWKQHYDRREEPRKISQLLTKGSKR